MKFDTAVADAAYLIAGSGFALYEEGSVQESGWNALVEVTSTGLLNIGADADLIERLVAERPETRTGEALTWIREDSQGFVDTVKVGPEAEQAWLTEFDGD